MFRKKNRLIIISFTLGSTSQQAGFARMLCRFNDTYTAISLTELGVSIEPKEKLDLNKVLFSSTKGLLEFPGVTIS